MNNNNINKIPAKIINDEKEIESQNFLDVSEIEEDISQCFKSLNKNLGLNLDNPFYNKNSSKTNPGIQKIPIEKNHKRNTSETERSKTRTFRRQFFRHTAKLIYEKDIENINKRKIEKLKEINKNFDGEISDLKVYLEEESKFDDKNSINNNLTTRNNCESTVKLIYDCLLNDKKNEILKIEKEYESQKNQAKLKYEKALSNEKFIISGKK